MAELSAFVSTNTDGQMSDSDSDTSDDQGSFEERFVRDHESTTRSTEARRRFSWLPKLRWFGSSRENYRPLSVQSGDIVYSSASANPHAPSVHGIETTTCTSDVAIPHTAATTAQDLVVDYEAITDREVRGKGGFYSFAFPIVHLIVKCLFYHQKYSVVPLIVLAVHFLSTVMLILLAIYIYPPSINLSIKAFTIPNHPAQIHWDAYKAAKAGNFWNNSVNGSPDETDAVYHSQTSKVKDILKRNIIEGCNRVPGVNYQAYLHIYWELDLVFRVPKGSPDQNILTEKRIRRIHEIEEYIYELPDYKDFCHKTRGASFCDPINSLLTWLYPRNQQDGSFVYNPDHFTPNLAESLRQLKKNYTNALWFTAGQVTVVNSTTFIAKLLRSQVRVGLPFPCFTYTGDRQRDRYNEEAELVTKFFVSLIPFLDSASTSEVEVLYGGPNVYEYEVKSASLHDVYLAVVSLALVLVLAFIMSGFSFWLTIVALYAIASSFPLAFSIYTNIFAIDTVGLLNLVSLFVIIGIGIDDILVFINTYKQSARLAGLNTVHKRITHTIIEASKATFFTSLTTSVAFFANAISSIPAVYQFGVFMGLIVILCYVQVVLVVPFALHVWQSYFLVIENLLCYPCGLLCRKRRAADELRNLPAVRMTNRPTGDGDSGIEILGNGNGSSEVSDNSSTASSSSVSDTNVLIPEPEMETEHKSESTVPLSSHLDDHIEEDNPLMHMEVTVVDETRIVAPVLTESISDFDRSSNSSAERRWTELQQIGMMRFVARPVMIFFLLGSRFSKCKAALLSWTMVLVFVTILASSWVGTAFLKPTDRPPQFFKPDSNIQKMLDLTGNLTDIDTLNCYSCSAWYGQGSIPTVKPPSSPPNSPPPSPPSSNPPHPKPSDRTTPPESHANPPTPNPATKPNPPPQTQVHHVFATTKQPSNSNPVTKPSNPHPEPRTTAAHNHPPPDMGHVTEHPTSAGPGTNENIVANQFSNNAVVYVVFGIDGVKRKYDASHVIPEEGDRDFAELDSKFNSSFSCPLQTDAISKVTAALRAMCRVCQNISNPDNGLVLKGNFQCFAPSLISDLSCMSTFAHSVPECRPFLIPSSTSKITVKAEAKVYDNKVDGTTTLRYLAMAFRSTSNPSEDPFRSMGEYQRWEEFLENEIREISENKALYGEAGDILSSAFHTGEYWVQVNIELVAVYGSIYGILISFSLCSLVVAILSHNWRIVLSMFLTIMAILFSLLGIFSMLGWTLGIVEAVSLSILVGNALDYCIHLSEGYMAVDSRHLAFVERFKFASGASLRVKKVMAAISFIGVSIISSAITTIVAIIPLLGTWIQLFTRFGSILLIETLVAIVYTLVFCSTFLGLCGPLKTKLTYRVVNALGTIFGTIGFYLLGLIALFIAAKAGINIPGPDGRPLFG